MIDPSSENKNDATNMTARRLASAAFAFDIDGVLLHGSSPLPGAAAALARVRAAGVPHVFLTNGGGILESERAAQLAALLGGRVHESQVILAHTPMRELATAPFAAAPILAVGGKRSVEVARAYGFARAFSPYSVAAAYPHAVPLAPGGGEAAAAAPKLPAGVGSRGDPFGAVITFQDPACYTTDLQVVLDVLLGGGVIDERPDPAARQSVRLIFSNPDLLYANAHPAPRLGQGAFQTALRAVYREVTGRDLTYTMYGKPTAAPYAAARAALAAQAAAAGAPPPSTIFMIGDNPAADIAGARAAGPPWKGLLVRTGVAAGDCAIHPAHRVFDSVGDAVDYGLRNTS